MATTYTVVKGDTLWGIANRFLRAGNKYPQIAAANGIKNPDVIYIGQVLTIPADGEVLPSTPTASGLKITGFGRNSVEENQLVATWTWSKYSETEKYRIYWTYKTEAGIEIGNIDDKNVDQDAPHLSLYSTFDIPEKAKFVYFKVKPVAKKKGESGKEVEPWTENWSEKKEFNCTDELPPATPESAPPKPTMNGLQLTMTLDGLDEEITSVDFQVFRDNNASPVTSHERESVNTGHASYSCAVTAGSVYKYRYRLRRNDLVSGWSPYSDNVYTIPNAPEKIETIRASSETSVYLKWTASNVVNTEVDTKVTYEIQYATKLEYFDVSDQVKKISSIEFSEYDVSGLDSGAEYFFRVRATNSEGESSWTPIVSVIVGTTPEAPTTWSSTTTAITGEDVILYWVHNCEDESTMTRAELKLYIDGLEDEYTFIVDEEYENSVVHYIPLSKEDLEDGRTHSCILKSSQYVEGVTIKWEVRTAGITMVPGKWSTQREIDIYAPPTLDLQITDPDGNSLSTITSFPFHIKGVAGPKTQSPIGYHLTITSNESYETADNLGNPQTVNVGDAVYSSYFDTFQALSVEFTPGNVDLESSIRYTVTCVVSMDSGLTARDTKEFNVSWTDVEYRPNAAIGVDPDTYSVTLRPYCEDRRDTNYQVDYADGVYTVTDIELGNLYNDGVVSTTSDGSRVYRGIGTDGSEVYFCVKQKVTPITNVTMAVYRREFDGGFTELATELDGANYTTITDPHPSLDYARYRIVAKSKDTGAVSFYDMPSYPINGKAVIIQWDEEWAPFETTEDEPAVQPPWSGSLLKLPYNIDVSESTNPEVEMIEYIGRSNPVSYYGTQRRQTTTWNVAIEKSDKETIYALRKLANWLGDAYVREPSGIGYWAHVVVSFDQKHLDLTIPVTFTITRVEGGA